MPNKKSQEFNERISGSAGEQLLKQAQEQWNHEDFRKRVLELVVEHEGTRGFEDAVSDIIERYIKIKTSERVFWFIGIIVVGFITFLIGKFK